MAAPKEKLSFEGKGTSVAWMLIEQAYKACRWKAVHMVCLSRSACVFHDDVAVNVLRCWADILGTKNDLSLEF